MVVESIIITKVAIVEMAVKGENKRFVSKLRHLRATRVSAFHQVARAGFNWITDWHHLPFKVTQAPSYLRRATSNMCTADNKKAFTVRKTIAVYELHSTNVERPRRKVAGQSTCIEKRTLAWNHHQLIVNPPHGNSQWWRALTINWTLSNNLFDRELIAHLPVLGGRELQFRGTEAEDEINQYFDIWPWLRPSLRRTKVDETHHHRGGDPIAWPEPHPWHGHNSQLF
jgi:hypothetical protein